MAPYMPDTAKIMLPGQRTKHVGNGRQVQTASPTLIGCISRLHGAATGGDGGGRVGWGCRVDESGVRKNG